MFITYLEVIDNQYQLISRKQLVFVYRKETNANIKERILLVKRVRYDKQEATSVVAETELGKTRVWAYKWLYRFDKDGLEGLKDKERRENKNSTKPIEYL